jgi:hypothetical protein
MFGCTDTVLNGESLNKSRLHRYLKSRLFVMAVPLAAKYAQSSLI